MHKNWKVFKQISLIRNYASNFFNFIYIDQFKDNYSINLKILTDHNVRLIHRL